MIFVGYYVAKMFASGVAQRRCISLECGLQNGTLAVVVATQLFDEMVFMVPTAAYALIMFVTSIFFVLIVYRGIRARGFAGGGGVGLRKTHGLTAVP